MPHASVARVLLCLLILASAVLITFFPVLRNDFVNFDDQKEIIENPDLNPVTLHKLNWNWTHTRLTLYMPITYMAWGAIAAIAPRNPAGILQPAAFHAVSLALHLACSILLFLLIWQLFHRLFPACIGALVFAIHPLQAEPVAWASGMYTLLSTALSLGALMAYAAWVKQCEHRRACEVQRQTSNLQIRTSNVQRPTSNVEVMKIQFSSVGRWTLNVERWTFALPFYIATMLYIAALLTKAASVSLPLAAGVIDLFILARPPRQVIKFLSLWIVLAIPIILLAKHFQDVSMLPAAPILARAAVALDSVGFYLGKIILPIHLIPDYGRNPNWVMHHLIPAMVSAAIAIITILIAWLARRTSAWITAGIGLLIAGVSPYLGLTAFDFQYISTVADRYAYFGMVGIAILIAGAVARSRIAAVMIVIAIPIWSMLTIHQIERWRNSNTLFSYTLNENPRSLLSHNVFGYLAARDHHFSQAEGHYLAALNIWPEDAIIQFDLGNLYMTDHPDQAAKRYALAVQYQPKMVLYRNSLAAALARTGHFAEAYDQWQQVIADDPAYLDAHNNLADLLLNAGKTGQARHEYQVVLTIDPANPHAIARLNELWNK